MMLIAGCATAAVTARDAVAHSGNPAIAFLTTPPTCSTTVAAGDLYPIRWLDSDTPIVTGTATVNLYATLHIPQTFNQGTLPMGLREDSIVVVEGLREADRANVWWWDTTDVPSGTWFIWSGVREPAIEMSINITNFAPGTLTVIRPGEDLKPSIMVVKPDSPFRFADDEYLIQWCGRDPSGDARVKLEATAYRDATEFELLADDLPASGTFEWNTNCLFEGDWSIKATISTPDGYEQSAFGRYFLLVTHPVGSRDAGGLNEGCVTSEGGVADASSSDAGELADLGVIAPIKKPADESCGCSTTKKSTNTALVLFAFVAAFLSTRARDR